MACIAWIDTTNRECMAPRLGQIMIYLVYLQIGYLVPHLPLREAAVQDLHIQYISYLGTHVLDHTDKYGSSTSFSSSYKSYSSSYKTGNLSNLGNIYLRGVIVKRAKYCQ